MNWKPILVSRKYTDKHQELWVLKLWPIFFVRLCSNSFNFPNIFAFPRHSKIIIPICRIAFLCCLWSMLNWFPQFIEYLQRTLTKRQHDYKTVQITNTWASWIICQRTRCFSPSFIIITFLLLFLVCLFNLVCEKRKLKQKAFCKLKKWSLLSIHQTRILRLNNWPLPSWYNIISLDLSYFFSPTN